MIFIRIVSGLALLTLGRRLFWLFVGAIGFAAGIALAGQLLSNQTDLIQISLAVIIGLVGAVLAVMLQRIALIAAGFLGGGYLVYTLADYVPIQSDILLFGAVLLGALIGASLVAKVFDAGLIILSSLIGALLIIQSFELQPALTLTGLIVIAVVGMLIQMKPKKKSKD